jgi:hypothetical protein
LAERTNSGFFIAFIQNNHCGVACSATRLTDEGVSRAKSGAAQSDAPTRVPRRALARPRGSYKVRRRKAIETGIVVCQRVPALETALPGSAEH